MNQEQCLKISSVLAEKGINIPFDPSPEITSPLPWLIRGERYFDDVLHTKKLTSKPGEFGKFGVFMADNLQNASWTGIQLILETSDITNVWLKYPSDEAKKILQEITNKFDLNPNSVTGGLTAERILYENYPVYQLGSGISTSPTPIPLDIVAFIIAEREAIIKQRIKLPELGSRLILV